MNNFKASLLLASFVTLNAWASLVSIKLRVGLTMDRNEMAETTIIAPNGEWVSKSFGDYTLKTRAVPKGDRSVDVQLEMNALGNGATRKGSVTLNWDANPSLVESKDDKGKLLYRVSIAAFKNELNDAKR